MKTFISTTSFWVIYLLLLSSCGTTVGTGGSSPGVTANTSIQSVNYYDLVPVGDRVTYTIDISTPEGQKKLHKLTLDEAQRLAETEAARKYKCDRLIDPRYDYLKRGKRILRITVDGRPGFYRNR